MIKYKNIGESVENIVCCLGTQLWMMKLMSHQYWLRVCSLVIDSTMLVKRKQKKIVVGFSPLFFSPLNSKRRERWVTSSMLFVVVVHFTRYINTILFDGGMKEKKKDKKWRGGERKKKRVHIAFCTMHLFFWLNRREKQQKTIDRT